MLLDKFRSCLAIGLDAKPAAIDALADCLMQFDRADNAAAIVAAFPG
jgi:hypothetical protein